MSFRPANPALLGALPWLLPGCLPELDARSSFIDAPRVIAVVAEPPEARPGATVRYEVLAVDPNGRDLDPDVHWSSCDTPRASVDNGAVNAACYDRPGAPLPQQRGITAEAPLPLQACARFGPEPPPGNARPRDPDLTGGFYQPIIIHGHGDPTVYLERLLCNPRAAPIDVARELAAAYQPNRNPAPPALRLRDSRSEEVASTLQTETSVELELTWASEDAERYVWIDPAARLVTERREALLISWFANGGTLAFERNEIAEASRVTSSNNRWTAPSAPGRVQLWAVLRDSRGGVAFVQRDIEIVK